ncbi:glycosyltransferase family 4 protein [Lyngbya confervoides]|uniref:Glycosyltransferase family 4 protein n=1 Tax=Lyngbya confervoides BDU141951 TaxID=1574623 RepID=A0ABD4T318_9CYAN|nr:glycosyltransferase family 4 protein [Lyngbya confervoides]MCM1983011.1 glycosyltransferase family 4 protein [Lyngbya confervoides BDU141951]
MKIAFVTLMAGYSWGGSEYLWSATAERALIEDHEVLLSIYDWSTNHPAITRMQAQGAELHVRTRFPRPSPLAIRIKQKIERAFPYLQFNQPSPFHAVYDWQPDIICISQGGSYDISCFIDLLNFLLTTSVPFWIICQFNFEVSAPSRGTEPLIKAVFSKAKGVAFVSRHNLNLAERHLYQTLPNAIVVQNPTNLSDRTKVEWPIQPKVSFACVARLEAPIKGQDALFEVLSSQIWRERDWECNLYGAGPDRDYLENLAHHYDVRDRIHFKGHINDIRLLWAENHLLVMPSRAEGTPLSLVEAMLCGRPAVVTDVGGNAEWITEGRTGFIAESASPKSLNAALERAWLAQDNWKQMGDTAHEDAIAKIDPSPGSTLLKLIGQL